jgi:integrase
LDSITTREVREYIGHLRKQKGRRGETFSASTIRTYLNSLSQLFRRAESEGLVTPGFNPVRSLIEKPSPRRLEARRLEVHEAALFLEAARLYKPQRKGTSLPFGHALIATFLLTGGRESEVLGLEVEDVSFDRKAVTFRPNKWRRLKALTSHRTVPLWPQLEAILREYLYGGETPRVTGLLFPSPRTEKPSLIVDLRKLLDSVAESAGWKAGEIRTKMFRHTYCAARLQTLDHGAPVSVYTGGA